MSIRLDIWNKLPKGLKVVIWTLLGITFFTTMVFVFGWVIQLLWNATIADMFGLPAITYWQSVGIFILAKILFGFGVGGGSKSSHGRKKKHNSDIDRNEKVSETEGISDLANEESFQKFWQQDGRQAYEEFKHNHGASDT
jgi:hypothetical protein